MLLHHKKVTGDIKAIEDDFNNGQYVVSGGVAADLVILVLGKVDVSPATNVGTNSLAFLQ